MSSLLNWINVNHAADVAQLVGIPLAAIALWIAAIQLKDAARTANKAEAVAEVQAVLALDQVLAQQTFIELRAKLAAGKTGRLGLQHASRPTAIPRRIRAPRDAARQEGAEPGTSR
jgi:hypothetical protein